MPPDNPDAMTELIPLALEALAKQEEKDMTETIQLSQHLLGVEPYILIQITGDDPDDPENVIVNLEHGGGISNKAAAIEFLKAVIESAEENNIG